MAKKRPVGISKEDVPEQAIRDGIMDFVRDGTTKTIGRIERSTPTETASST